MFRCVTLAGIIGVGIYTGMKAAYLSTRLRDARRGAQPHLRRAAALHRHGDRARAAPRQLVRARGRDGVRLLSRRRHAVPDGRPALLGRTRPLDPPAGEPLPLLDADRRRSGCCSACSRAASSLVVALALLRGRARLAGVLAAVLAVGIVAWNLTGEIAPPPARTRSAATPRRRCAIRSPGSTTSPTSSRRSTSAKGGATRTRSGCSSSGTARSSPSSSLDGTVGGPGPAGAPNITRGRDALLDIRSRASRAPVRLRGRGLSVRRLRRHVRGTALLPRRRRDKVWHLVQLTHPNRLRAECSGIYPDGWSGRPTARTTASPTARTAGCASSSHARTGAGRPGRARSASSSHRS